MNWKRGWFVFVALLALGCAGRQIDVLTNIDHDFDFSKPHTYTWQNTPPEDLLKNIFPAPGVEMRDLDARIRAAADAELQEKGFTRADPADLVVTYAATASERISEQAPTTTDWDPSTGPKYGSAVLALDILDPATNVRVWRGAAMTDLRSGEGRKKVGDVVRRILEEFPPHKG